MSGHKCSEFHLEAERAEKLRLLQKLGSLEAEVNGLRERIAEALGGASEGLRATFAGEVEGARQWLSRRELPAIDGPGMDTDLGLLQAADGQLEQAAAEGRRLQEALTVAFTEQASEMGQRLARRLAEVERLHIRRRQLLELWFGEEPVRAWERALQDAGRLLGEERYAALETALADVEADIAAQGEIAEAQEDRHQKRLYLLKALRQVCAEMGFAEAAPPRYERAGERGSRILFTADTLDRGQIAFTLSLEGISSFSEIADNRCFEEFGQLSQYLEDAFGIHTRFRLADGQPAPRLIRKGERDLPEDTGRQAAA